MNSTGHLTSRITYRHEHFGHWRAFSIGHTPMHDSERLIHHIRMAGPLSLHLPHLMQNCQPHSLNFELPLRLEETCCIKVHSAFAVKTKLWLHQTQEIRRFAHLTYFTIIDPSDARVASKRCTQEDYVQIFEHLASLFISIFLLESATVRIPAQRLKNLFH